MTTWCQIFSAVQECLPFHIPRKGAAFQLRSVGVVCRSTSSNIAKTQCFRVFSDKRTSPYQVEQAEVESPTPTPTSECASLALVQRHATSRIFVYDIVAPTRIFPVRSSGYFLCTVFVSVRTLIIQNIGGTREK